MPRLLSRGVLRAVQAVKELAAREDSKSAARSRAPWGRNAMLGVEQALPIPVLTPAETSCPPLLPHPEFHPVPLYGVRLADAARSGRVPRCVRLDPLCLSSHARPPVPLLLLSNAQQAGGTGQVSPDCSREGRRNVQ